MAVTLNPYLSFDGSARDAMTHYRDVFGGELTISTFGDFGQAGTPIEHLVMHSQLTTPNGMTIMGADTPPGMDRHPGNTVTVVISGDEEELLRRYWDGLSAGGTVDVALEPQMWGDTYGQCTDRFGVIWQMNISTPAG
jgi:PhnB protein